MYIRRALEDIVMQSSQSFSALIVSGPRQVGKTTLLRQLADEKRNYVSLDDPLARTLAVEDPSLFLARYSPPVIIDEIQYAPQLLPHIKMHIDEHPSPGDFWMTGSQMFHMMKNVSESLAGRIAVIQMFGFSKSEMDRAPSFPFQCNHEAMLERMKTRQPLSITELYSRIYKGSMPTASLPGFNHNLFYSSYISTYLQRDIRDLTQVGDELAFFRFITACAARTAQMVNYADLARDVGISEPTAKKWLSVLVSSGIIELVQPYFNNILKRAIKTPKMYFTDTGLCAYLTRWDSAKTLEVSAMSGAFFETYAVSEILKSYHNAGKRPAVYYYRDTDGKEIDLLIDNNGTLYPIEIKRSMNPGKDALKHFSVLDKPTGKYRGEGAVICLYKDVFPLDMRNWMIPVWLI